MKLGGLRDKCAEHTDCRGMLHQKTFRFMFSLVLLVSGGFLRLMNL